MNKFLKFPLVRIILAVLIVGLGLIVGQFLLTTVRSLISLPAASANILALLLIAPLLLIAYQKYVHWIEKRTPEEIGLNGMASEWAIGALIGFILFALVIGILWLLGVYRSTGLSFSWLVLIGAACGALISALAQELIFRAIIFRITESWLGTWWAVLISALFFGLIHLTQEGATLVSALAIALQAGVMLAAAYALTGRLWIALGLHSAWDFANDGIFGVGQAGQTGQALQGILKASLSGPDLLTGGHSGVEASLAAIIITLAAGFLLLGLAHRRGRISARTFSTRASAAVSHPES